MNKEYPSTLSPKERIPFGYSCWHMLRLYKSRQFLTIWSMMMVIPIGACILRFSLQPPNSVIGFIPVLGISGGAAVAIVSSLMTGEMITNLGLFLRSSEPIRYWLAVFVCVICYISPIGFVWPSRVQATLKAEQIMDANLPFASQSPSN